MKKYFAVFLRKFEVEIEADTIAAAQVKAEAVVTQFPVDAKGNPSCKLHSITAEDYVEPPEADDKQPTGPKGKPPTGPTPGTPTVTPLIITDATRRAA